MIGYTHKIRTNIRKVKKNKIKENHTISQVSALKSPKHGKINDPKGLPFPLSATMSQSLSSPSLARPDPNRADPKL